MVFLAGVLIWVIVFSVMGVVVSGPTVSVLGSGNSSGLSGQDGYTFFMTREELLAYYRSMDERLSVYRLRDSSRSYNRGFRGKSLR
jgi:hypothetical protein